MTSHCCDVMVATLQKINGYVTTTLHAPVRTSSSTTYCGTGGIYASRRASPFSVMNAADIRVKRLVSWRRQTYADEQAIERPGQTPRRTPGP